MTNIGQEGLLGTKLSVSHLSLWQSDSRTTNSRPKIVQLC